MKKYPQEIIKCKDESPHSPEYINVVDDDSDDEICCLGVFKSEPSDDIQITSVKEEVTSSSPAKNEIPVPNIIERNQFQPNSSFKVDSLNCVKRTFPLKVSVSSSTLEKTPAGEKYCGKSQPHNIPKRTSPSVIGNNITDYKQTSPNNSGSPPGKSSSTSYENAVGKCANKLLDNQEIKENRTQRSVPDASTGTVKIVAIEDPNLSQVKNCGDTNSLFLTNPSRGLVQSFGSSPSLGSTTILNTQHKDDPISSLVNKHSSQGTKQSFVSNVKTTDLTVPTKQNLNCILDPTKIIFVKRPGSNVFKYQPVVNKQPVNTVSSKDQLACSENDTLGLTRSQGYKDSDVNGPAKVPTVNDLSKAVITSPEVVLPKNNIEALPENIDKDGEGSELPKNGGTIFLTKKFVNLKGFKYQDILSWATTKQTCDFQETREADNTSECPTCGVAKTGHTNDSTTRTFVDQSSQTEIHCWTYKNSKLYRFIEDGPAAVIEQEPVKILRRVKNTVGNGTPSPKSSLEHDTEYYVSDYETSTDESDTVNELCSVENSPSQTDFTEHSEKPTDTVQNRATNFQPQSTFQEVLYSGLGLYNADERSREISQPGSHDNQINVKQEKTDCETVWNHELQMLVSRSRKTRPEPIDQRPQEVTPDTQILQDSFSTRPEPVIQHPENDIFSDTQMLPDFNFQTPPAVVDIPPPETNVVEIFNKLIADIKTCVTSDAQGNIPLHRATMDNDIAKLKSQCIVLKTIKSNLNHVNLAHETALMLAVKVAVTTGDCEAVSLLVSEGADPRVADLDGNTPLHYAVKHGCSQLVRVLLTADDADKVIEKFNYDGFTPLHIAAMEGHDEIIKLLVSTNIDVNVKDRKNGRTPYFLAIKEKKQTSAELLKMFGADVNARNFADQTPHPIISPEKNTCQDEILEEIVDDPIDIAVIDKGKMPDKSPPFCELGTGKRRVISNWVTEKDCDWSPQAIRDNQGSEQQVNFKKQYKKDLEMAGLYVEPAATLRGKNTNPLSQSPKVYSYPKACTNPTSCKTAEETLKAAGKPINEKNTSTALHQPMNPICDSSVHTKDINDQNTPSSNKISSSKISQSDTTNIKHNLNNTCSEVIQKSRKLNFHPSKNDATSTSNVSEVNPRIPSNKSSNEVKQKVLSSMNKDQPNKETSTVGLKQGKGSPVIHDNRKQSLVPANNQRTKLNSDLENVNDIIIGGDKVEISYNTLIDDIVNDEVMKMKSKPLQLQEINPDILSKNPIRKAAETELLLRLSGNKPNSIELPDSIHPTNVSNLTTFRPKQRKKVNPNPKKEEKIKFAKEQLLSLEPRTKCCEDREKSKKSRKRKATAKSEELESKPNESVIPNEPTVLVSNMRNKLADVVACKVLFKQNHVGELKKPFVSTENQANESKDKTTRISNELHLPSSRLNSTGQSNQSLTSTIPEASEVSTKSSNNVQSGEMKTPFVPAKKHTKRILDETAVMYPSTNSESNLPGQSNQSLVSTTPKASKVSIRSNDALPGELKTQISITKSQTKEKTGKRVRRPPIKLVSTESESPQPIGSRTSTISITSSGQPLPKITARRRSNRSLSTDSESNYTEKKNRPPTGTPKQMRVHSPPTQNATSKKRSLESDEHQVRNISEYLKTTYTNTIKKSCRVSKKKR